uniref:Uncharacterized protein n=1 Tax=Haptolina ericina TaxID=156174 RepID=A0A7S3B5I5_9EUKA
MPNLPRPPSDLEQRPGLFRRRSTENNTTDGSWHSADCTRDSEEWPTAEIARPSSSAIQTAACAASSSTVLPQNSATGRASTAGAASPRGVANPTVEAAARLLSEMQDGGDPSQAGRAVKERAKGGKGFFGGKAKEAATSKRGGQRSGTEEGEALLGQPDNGQEDAGRRGRKGLWRRAEKKKTETAWEILHRLQKEEAKIRADASIHEVQAMVHTFTEAAEQLEVMGEPDKARDVMTVFLPSFFERSDVQATLQTVGGSTTSGVLPPIDAPPHPPSEPYVAYVEPPRLGVNPPRLPPAALGGPSALPLPPPRGAGAFPGGIGDTRSGGLPGLPGWPAGGALAGWPWQNEPPSCGASSNFDVHISCTDQSKSTWSGGMKPIIRAGDAATIALHAAIRSASQRPSVRNTTDLTERLVDRGGGMDEEAVGGCCSWLCMPRASTDVGKQQQIYNRPRDNSCAHVLATGWSATNSRAASRRHTSNE